MTKAERFALAVCNWKKEELELCLAKVRQYGVICSSGRWSDGKKG